MVYLNRIYTRTGDTGETGLGDGARVRKDDHRIEAMGDVDELNAALGLALAEGSDVPERELLLTIQNDLFDVGADLCVPQVEGPTAGGPLRVSAGQVEQLESAIDRLNQRLQPLTSFVLPGGTTAAAGCHLARTICRRAERRVVTLMAAQRINVEVLKYLNRLSDLLFVLARVANGAGQGDVLWVPGASR